jgi:hypothetical protein
MNYSDFYQRKRAMEASASSAVLWDMEGQAMDLHNCLTDVRNAIASEKPEMAGVACREVRDRIAQLLKSCDELEDRVKLDQLLSKCPE